MIQKHEPCSFAVICIHSHSDMHYANLCLHIRDFARELVSVHASSRREVMLFVIHISSEYRSTLSSFSSLSLCQIVAKGLEILES